MLLEQIKNIKSRPKDLRNFSFLLAAVLIVIGGYQWWRGGEYFVHWLVSAAVLAVVGLVFPVILYPIHKVWMILSIVLGWIMTRIILVLLFYLVFTPLGLIARLLGKTFLQWRFDSNAQSYWEPRREQSSDESVYERQF